MPWWLVHKTASSKKDYTLSILKIFQALGSIIIFFLCNLCGWNSCPRFFLLFAKQSSSQSHWKLCYQLRKPQGLSLSKCWIMQYLIVPNAFQILTDLLNFTQREDVYWALACQMEHVHNAL